MTSKIFWTRFSEKQILLIKDYYLRHYSKQAFSDLKKSLYNSVDKLEANPLIGQREASLIHLNREIRYLVVKSYKVLYLPQGDLVYVLDIFDTRQNPTKMDRSTKS